MLFASDTESPETAESLVKTQPAEKEDGIESPQRSSSPNSSLHSVEASKTLPDEVAISGSPSAKSTAAVDHSCLPENGKDPEITPSNQESVQKTVSDEAEETPPTPLPTDHSPKSDVTWKSLERRRFNYDIIPKVFCNVNYTVNPVIQLPYFLE